MTSYNGTDNLEIMEEAVNYNRYLENLIVANGPVDGQVLDFGAGIGTFASRVLERGFGVHCLEVDAAQAATIERKGMKVVASVAGIPDEAYHYVYSLNVFEHIDDDEQALRELYRVVKLGGSVLIYVPAMQVLFSSMDRKVGHCRRYSKGSLVQLAVSAGFTVEKSYYVDSLGFPATLIYKWFGKESGELSRLPLILYDRIAFPISRLIDRLTGSLFGKNVYVVLVKNPDH